jgi:hypothetical protein
MISTIPWLTLFILVQSSTSLTYIPVTSMWVIALHSPFLYFYLPQPRHSLSDWLRLFFKPNIFLYKYPNILNPSHTSHLPAYEDETDIVFCGYVHTYLPIKMEKTVFSKT